MNECSFFGFAMRDGIEVGPEPAPPRTPPTAPVACPFCREVETLRADGEIPLERDTLLKPYGIGQTFTCTHCKGEFIVPTWK